MMMILVSSICWSEGVKRLENDVAKATHFEVQRNISLHVGSPIDFINHRTTKVFGLDSLVLGQLRNKEDLGAYKIIGL